MRSQRVRSLAALRLAVVVCAAATLFGCSSKPEVISLTADRIQITDAQIDADPVALLPSGSVGLMYMDAPALFRSRFGTQLLRTLKTKLPVPASAGFEPSRDLKTMHIGFYSMQGADIAAIARGSFNREAIEAAADGTPKTPLGTPISVRNYAGRKIYVSRTLGFVVLTSQTVVFGNETGIRRVLDRIEQGRIMRDIPSSVESLFDSPGAAMVMGMDIREHPEVSALETKWRFLKGLESARVLGNFQEPGINFAGTMTYKDEGSAAEGAQSIRDVREWIKAITFFATWFGYGDPIKQLEVRPNGKAAQFVVGLDAASVNKLIDGLGGLLGK